MSRLIEDDELLDDMARTLAALRLWALEVAEQHERMETGVITNLLSRYRTETGRNALAEVSEMQGGGDA